MKHKLLSLVIMLMAMAFNHNAYAYDFSAVAPSGQTLYYNIVGDHVDVVNPGSYNYVSGNLTIPATVTYNGTTYPVISLAYFDNRGTFQYCSGLTSITISQGITTIGQYAFEYCSGLTTLTFPGSITSFGEGACHGCYNLNRTNYTGSIAEWCNIEFFGWSNPMVFSRGFYMDSVLVTELVIPEGITELTYNAFENNDAFTSVYFPSTLTTIGERAFAVCTNLRAFYFKSPNPPSIGPNAFLDVPSDKVFYVPCQYYQNYVNVWGNTYNIVCYELPLLQFNITINSNDSSWGTGSYLALGDSIAEVTATANYGYHFDHWNYGSTANPDTLLLSSDVTITAIFAKNQYTVTGTSNDDARGLVTGSATVDYLDSVTLTATPNYGFHFQRWNDYHTENPRTVAATGDINLTAAFDLNQYTITLAADTSIHGTVSGAGEYNYLSEHNISATANYGYHFAHWNDGNTDNPRTITLTQDTHFVAIFERNTYSLTANVNDVALGSVSFPDGDSALYLDTLRVVATPMAHRHVVSWTGPGITATSTNKDTVWVAMTENRAVSCTFAIDTHTVVTTVNDIARGMVTQSGTEFVYGTPCTVEATAYTGYIFAGWSNGVTATPYTFAVMEDVELTAIFVAPGEQTYTVTVSANDPAMGTATVNGNATATVTGGTEVTLAATPNAGYRFVCWNDNNTEATRTVTVNADMSFTAYFESDGTGIEDVDASNIKVFVESGRIHVTLDGQPVDEFRVYDAIGREVFCASHAGETPALPGGVFLVKIGNYPARRVVVIR